MHWANAVKNLTAARRGTEQLQRYARHERCERRGRDKAPVEVLRVVERRESHRDGSRAGRW
jgi:hypothetical protein